MMENEFNTEEPVQNQSEDQTVDLNEAFKLAQQMGKEPVGQTVEEPKEPTNPEPIQPQQQSEPASTSQQQPYQPTDIDNMAVSSGGYQVSGNDATANQRVDDYNYEYAARSLINDINRQANYETSKWLEKEGYKKITVDDLAIKDERTGDIRFKDPYRQNGYFNSLKEASDHVKAFNEQIDYKAQQYARQRQQELLQQERPRFELMKFAPKLNTMSELEVQFMDDLIKPYEVKDNAGEVIGYSCNLDAAYQQAKTLVASMKSRYGNIQSTQQQTASQEASRPATDVKSHGSQNNTSVGTGTVDDITDLSEALRFVQRREREKNGN